MLGQTEAITGLEFSSDLLGSIMRWLFERRVDCGLKRTVRQRFELFLQNPQLGSQLIYLPLLADSYRIKLLESVFLKSQLSLYIL